MCIGYYSNSGRWMIDARLVYNDTFPTETISFMIDSGAENSMISLLNAKKLGIDVLSLSGKKDLRGLGGGICKARVLYCNLAFLEEGDGEYHIEPCHELFIGEEKEHCQGNIIGLDILNRFNVITNFEARKISLERIKGIRPNYIRYP